jgi:hypothetical protein
VAESALSVPGYGAGINAAAAASFASSLSASPSLDRTAQLASERGRVALCRAVERDDAVTVRQLHAARVVDVLNDPCDATGRTALDLAVGQGRVRVVELLRDMLESWAAERAGLSPGHGEHTIEGPSAEQQQQLYEEMEEAEEVVSVQLVRGHEGFGLSIGEHMCITAISAGQHPEALRAQLLGATVVSVDGERYHSRRQLLGRMRSFAAGQLVTLGAVRRGRQEAAAAAAAAAAGRLAHAAGSPDAARRRAQARAQARRSRESESQPSAEEKRPAAAAAAAVMAGGDGEETAPLSLPATDAGGGEGGLALEADPGLAAAQDSLGAEEQLALEPAQQQQEDEEEEEEGEGGQQGGLAEALSPAAAEVTVGEISPGGTLLPELPALFTHSVRYEAPGPFGVYFVPGDGEPSGCLNDAPCPPCTSHGASIRRPFGAGPVAPHRLQVQRVTEVSEARCCRCQPLCSPCAGCLSALLTPATPQSHYHARGYGRS